MDLSTLTLDTPRLRLIPRATRHAEAILREYREPVIRYMNYGPPESLAALVDRIRAREADMREGRLLYMTVTARDSGEFLGCFALEGLDRRDPELGGWLKGDAHGRRFGLEAAAALRDWAGAHLDHDHLRWPCAAANVPSRRLAEALHGVIARTWDHRNARGHMHPYVEYWLPCPRQTRPWRNP